MFCPEGRRESGPSKRWDEGSLTEAEEQRVHTHAIDTEEAMGNQVGTDDHGLHEGTGAVSVPTAAQGNIPPTQPLPRRNHSSFLLISPPYNNNLTITPHPVGRALPSTGRSLLSSIPGPLHMLLP